METYFPFMSYHLERQMLELSPTEQRLVREIAQASKLQAQKAIDAIKKHHRKGGDQSKGG